MFSQNFPSDSLAHQGLRGHFHIKMDLLRLQETVDPGYRGGRLL